GNRRRSLVPKSESHLRCPGKLLPKHPLPSHLPAPAPTVACPMGTCLGKTANAVRESCYRLGTRVCGRVAFHQTQGSRHTKQSEKISDTATSRAIARR